MEFRNAVYNKFDTIDLEINHPDYGWIPFTASPDDPEQLGRDLYSEASTGTVAPYVEPIPMIPDQVSARQFKLQLLASDLLDEVDAWVATQSQAVQISYEYSGSFVRSEPMMQSGFTSLGFTSEQIDNFFLAASLL